MIFDCPPKLTAGCINALAASDFVLIPVILDALTARAVPHLLSALKRLGGDLLKHLSILGVAANLTTIRSGAPTLAEQEVRDDLNQKLRSVWGSDVVFFDTTIPDKSAFARAARSLQDGKLKLALVNDSIRGIFTDLAGEIEKEMSKHERRNTPAVSS